MSENVQYYGEFEEEYVRAVGPFEVSWWEYQTSMLTDPIRGIHTVTTHRSDGTVETREVPLSPLIFTRVLSPWGPW